MKKFKNTLKSLLFASLCTFYACEPPLSGEQGLSQQQTEQQRLEQQRFEQERAETARLEQERTAFTNSINKVLASDNGTSAIGDRTARTNAMRGIDLSQCPRDFAVAYVDHIHAWQHSAEAYAALSKLHEDGNVGAILFSEGLSRLLDLDAHPLGDAADAEKRLNNAVSEASAEIGATWEIVERTAVSHGATLPKP